LKLWRIGRYFSSVLSSGTQGGRDVQLVDGKTGWSLPKNVESTVPDEPKVAYPMVTR
jgi:hypothetical protein